MRIVLTDDQWREARRISRDVEEADNAALYVEHKGLMARYEVAALTGLNSTTLRKLCEGKKPTKAQLAALKYAALARAMNLS